MRTPEEIAAIIDRYNLADRDALRELEAHIRRELPIREILLFADFLHGGDFISSSGKWRRNSSGYVTQTHQEDTSLTRLWEGLVQSAHFYIGAASVLKMQDARLIAGYAFADKGDGPTLYDYTIDALIRAVPKEYRKQLDAASKLDDIKGLVEASKAQGDRIEGKVGDIDGKVNETQNAANLALKADRAIASKLKTVGPCIASAVERGMEKTTRAVSGARVQLDHLKDAIEKKDDDLEGVRQLQRATLAAVHGLKDGKPAQGDTTVPDHRDYQVTTTQLADLLTNLGAGRTARQIQLWEKHLKTDGREGTPPPDGYNLGTRLTIETATAWAQTFASHETDKLKTKIAFDDRFHQRPK